MVKYIDVAPAGNACPASVSAPAVPVNFRQTASSSAANGVIKFSYQWDSSNGNLSDLRDCQVSEYVQYPSSDNPFLLPLP